MSRAEKRRQQKQARKAEKHSRVQSLHPGGQATGTLPEGLLEELIQKGMQLHQAGRMQDAEVFYRQVLDMDSDHADANHLMGGLACQAGNGDLAVGLISKAIDKTPGQPMYHFNLGTVYQSLGRLRDAALSCRTALALKPDYAEAHFGLALSLQGLGQLVDAIESYDAVLVLNPGNIVSHNNRAAALQGLGRMDEAVAGYRQAIALSPGYAEAHANLAKVNLERGQFEDAIADSQRALTLDINLSESHSVLGNALQELGRFEEAADSYSRAVAFKPDFAEAHSNLGNVFISLGRLEEAVESCRRAIALKPDLAEFHGNLATALQKLGRLDEALMGYRRGIALDAEYAIAWNNLKSTAKAADYVDGRLTQSPDNPLAGIGGPPHETALFDYYMAAFKPHDADDRYHQAMAALPARDDQEIPIDGAAPRAGAAPVFADNIIGLLHFGRSGTGLLHSLIDGHPAISTLPGIYLRGYFNAGVWPALNAGGWRELPDRFMAMFEVLFDAGSPKITPGILEEKTVSLGVQEGMTTVGENRDESLYLDRDRFRTAALELLGGMETVDPLSFLKVVHAAYERCRGAASDRRTMFYHIHNPEDFTRLNFLRQAPHARLVMMVREPLQCCESWLRPAIADNDYGRATIRIINMLFAVDQVSNRHQDSVALRLEDLKARPEAAMAALCAWMGVADDPCLYEMTAQGKKWWGDPSSPDYGVGDSQSPFDDSALKRPVGSILSESDRFVLGTLFYPFAVRFGYRQADAAGFTRDLQAIRPLLDDLLDFEKAMAARAGRDHDTLKQSGDYRLFRAGLLERWATLDRFGDYPHMLTPLVLS